MQMVVLLVVAGLILLGLSLLADVLGIGGSPEFGYKQVAGSLAGVALVVAGLVVAGRRRGDRRPEPSDTEPI